MTEVLNCFRGLVYRPPIEKVKNVLAIRNSGAPGTQSQGSFYSIDRRSELLGLATAAQWAIHTKEEKLHRRHQPLVLQITISQKVLDKLPGVISIIVPGENVNNPKEKPIKFMSELESEKELTLLGKKITPVAYALLGLKVYTLGKGYSVRDPKLTLLADYSN
jgi:hypothetical protein